MHVEEVLLTYICVGRWSWTLCVQPVLLSACGPSFIGWYKIKKIYKKKKIWLIRHWSYFDWSEKQLSFVKASGTSHFKRFEFTIDYEHNFFPYFKCPREGLKLCLEKCWGIFKIRVSLVLLLKKSYKNKFIFI